MPEVAEVRQKGFMVGIDLGDHDAALRMGHRVTVEARKRGAFIRPLGNTVVLMPPLSISEDELRELRRHRPRFDPRRGCLGASRSPPSRLARTDSANAEKVPP